MTLGVGAVLVGVGRCGARAAAPMREAGRGRGLAKAQVVVVVVAVQWKRRQWQWQRQRQRRGHRRPWRHSGSDSAGHALDRVHAVEEPGAAAGGGAAWSAFRRGSLDGLDGLRRGQLRAGVRAGVVALLAVAGKGSAWPAIHVMLQMQR